MRRRSDVCAGDTLSSHFERPSVRAWRRSASFAPRPGTFWCWCAWRARPAAPRPGTAARRCPRRSAPAGRGPTGAPTRAACGRTRAHHETPRDTIALVGQFPPVDGTERQAHHERVDAAGAERDDELVGLGLRRRGRQHGPPVHRQLVGQRAGLWRRHGGGRLPRGGGGGGRRGVGGWRRRGRLEREEVHGRDQGPVARGAGEHGDELARLG